MRYRRCFCAAGLFFASGFVVWVLSVVIGEPAFVGADRAVTPPPSHIFESVSGLSGILSISGLVMEVSMIEGVRLLVVRMRLKTTVINNYNYMKMTGRLKYNR